MAFPKRSHWLFALLAVAAVPHVLRAEDPAPSAEPTAAALAVDGTQEAPAEQVDPNDGKIVLSTPTPGVVVDSNGDEVVEPLDAWEPVHPTAAPTKAIKPVSSDPVELDEVEEEDTAEEESDSDEPVELESVETDAQLPEDAANRAALQSAIHPRRIQLSKVQRRRMAAVKLLRRKVVREQRKALGLNTDPTADPRGEPEVRLCSLNMNNFGGKEDYKRVFKGPKLPLRAKLEQSALSAVNKARCDVIAVQVLLGFDDESLRKGLKVFEGKLKTQTGSEWETHLSPANRDIVRNAFLLRKGSVEFVRADSFGTMKFSVFGAFQGAQFARMPFEVVLKVKGKGKSPERTLLLMTYDFRNTFGPNDVEPETLRMQMADALRQLIHTEARKFSAEDPPIVALLGDRRGPRQAPATQLLEGKSRLVDFTQNGGCALDADSKKVSCKAGVTHLKEFFGVSAEGLGAPPVVETKQVEGVAKKFLKYPPQRAELARVRRLAGYTSEIYLQAKDLDLALEKLSLPGRYQAGTVPVSSGLPQSPLVWLELNW